MRFTETAVGHYMFVYAPVEYYMLLEYCNNHRSVHKRLVRVPVEAIEAIALHTGNPVFKTTTFRKAIMAYKRSGVFPRRKAVWTSREAVHYAKYSGMVHREITEAISRKER